MFGLKTGKVTPPGDVQVEMDRVEAEIKAVEERVEELTAARLSAEKLRDDLTFQLQVRRANVKGDIDAQDARIDEIDRAIEAARRDVGRLRAYRVPLARALAEAEFLVLDAQIPEARTRLDDARNAALDAMFALTAANRDHRARYREAAQLISRRNTLARQLDENEVSPPNDTLFPRAYQPRDAVLRGSETQGRLYEMDLAQFERERKRRDAWIDSRQ